MHNAKPLGKGDTGSWPEGRRTKTSQATALLWLWTQSNPVPSAAAGCWEFHHEIPCGQCSGPEEHSHKPTSKITVKHTFMPKPSFKWKCTHGILLSGLYGNNSFVLKLVKGVDLALVRSKDNCFS